MWSPIQQTWLEGFGRDLRLAARSLARNKGFTTVALLTIALGIGANTAIFEGVYGVLMKPLPYAHANRLVAVWMKPPAGSKESVSTGLEPTSSERRRTGWEGELGNGKDVPELSPADFADIRAQAKAFDQVAGADPYTYTLTNIRNPAKLRAFRVSRGFFTMAYVKPLLGRTLLPRDHTANGDTHVAVLSAAGWRKYFDANPKIVGQTIHLNRQAYTVVGVMPPSFQLPVGGYWTGVDLWTPIPETAASFQGRRSAYWPVIARLAPGVTPAETQADLATIGSNLAAQYPRSNRTRSFCAVPLRKAMAGVLRPVLLILQAAAGLLLLIALANAASLISVRAVSRQREMAIRTALGASAGKVARHLMSENLILVFGGAVLGVAIACGFVPLLVSLSPRVTPLFSSVDVNMNGAGVAFAGCLAGIFLLLFAFGPVRRLIRSRQTSRLDLTARGSGEKREARRLRKFLVVGQIAFSVMLLAGAGLLLRTLTNLLEIDPGFRTEHILSAQVNLYGTAHTDAQGLAITKQILTRLRTLPGVTSVAAVSNLPLQDTPVDYRSPIQVEGRPQAPGAPVHKVLHTIVTLNYFKAMGIALRSGRRFHPFDTAKSPRVAIVSEATVQRYWPGGNPIGSKVTLGYPVNGPATVVGVVEDVKHHLPDANPEPEVYVLDAQVPSRLMTFVVHTAGEAAALSSPVRGILRQALPGSPLGTIATMRHFRAEAFRPEWFSTFLLNAVAWAALLLASVGLFGAMNYAVAVQRREIAVRMALGAQRSDVVRRVLRQGLVLTIAGVAAGIVAALYATRFLTAMLFGITPGDPLTYVGIAVLLTTVALLASAVPAYAASRVDPMTTLRLD
ncbi:MAG: ABC transporter permease [Candidatus Acidiferrales bacterium]